MSNSIDPRDIRPMVFTSQADGPPAVDRPWERFQIISEDLLDQDSPWFKMTSDRQGLTITAVNGWAFYRRIKMASLGSWIWELCQSGYEAAS